MKRRTSDEHFPGYDVLSRADTWDAVTAGVVLSRLGPLPPLRFFTLEEEAVCRPLLDRLLALGDIDIPVFDLIDSRLAENETDGWRYDDMPEDAVAWKRSLAALGAEARERHRCEFVAMRASDQRDLLESIRIATEWRTFPGAHLWNLWMRYACAAFYSHPFAWNEIGFGGPAYPVGYENVGLDKREHWEVREVDAMDPEPWAHRVERARRKHQS